MWGRKKEIASLEHLLDKGTSSLVVMSGRRRIGKSTLAQQFGKKHFPKYFEFSGLAPQERQTNINQLDHFAKQLSMQTLLPGLKFDDWSEGFATLAKVTEREKNFILLDEISWMGCHDKDFAGKLKVAWDTMFKHNPKLLMVLCGSVSSWIEKNILKRADFVGRVSLQIHLRELPFSVVPLFWGKQVKRVSYIEILNILCVTGGVPKYLEEINPKASSLTEIARVGLNESGFLFNEFDKIFHDIFQKRAPIYKELIEAMSDSRRSAKEISNITQRPLNSDLSEYLMDLEHSGFIAKDVVYTTKGRATKKTFYRISDNYLKFYIKLLAPLQNKIRKFGYNIQSVNQLKQWDSFAGIQFEALLLNHLDELFPHLDIDPETIISASPYIQHKKTRNKGGCQIDLLIHCRRDNFYLCEFKFKKSIGSSVVEEVQKKIDIMERPKYSTIRPVLIYAGELVDSDLIYEFFDKTICFEKILGLA